MTSEANASSPVSTAALTAALESTVNHSVVRTALIAGGVAGGAAFTTASLVFPYVTIHEAVHAYSSSDDFIGSTPLELFRPSSTG